MTDPSTSHGVTHIRLRGRLTRADRQQDHYTLLAFDVRPGVAAIRVTLDHDPPGDAEDPTHGAVLDLGLIGPPPEGLGPPPFRGWSGSERRTIVVGKRWATPGYRPGPIEAGRWHVVLGLYGIPVGGCEYRVDVELLDLESADRSGARLAPDPSVVEPTAATAHRLPSRSKVPRWIACDLHAHSLHSDGAEEIATVAAIARLAGLEVLFITDHNTDSHVAELEACSAAAGLVLLAGEEVTTYGGHFNALGIRGWVEFRHTSADQVRSSIDAIHAQGGLASVNHPESRGSPWTYGPELPFDLVEVWNGPWRSENAAALEWWVVLLGSGRRVTAVGGSDMHSTDRRGQPVGTPITWVLATATGRDAVLDGLREGRVIVTRDASVALPALRVIDRSGQGADIGATLPVRSPIDVVWQADHQAGRRLEILSRRGQVLSADLGSDRAAGRVRLDRRAALASGHVRIEIRDDEGPIAFTNPVFLEES
ncbi:MAG: PHP domain-containing protein [Chloroflexi bacterium]|nr:PHP domain-containing protein [Chloroflexota bacterium]